MASSPSEPAATPESLLARAERNASVAGERLLVDFVRRLLDEQGVGALTALSESVLPALQSLVESLPRLVREGTTGEALAMARTLGEHAHERGLSLAALTAEGMRLHDRLINEVGSGLRDGDGTLAAVLLRISQALLQLGQAALVAYEERSLAGLTHLALSDSLTQLANRRAFDGRFEEELNRARRFDNTLALVLLDVDGLKSINDTFGHAAGDELLRVMAVVLREHTRSIDLVARIGGDEFALLLPESDRGGAQTLVQRLTGSLAEQRIEGRRVRFSAGIAIFPDDGGTVDDLLRHADQEMYRSKRGQ